MASMGEIIANELMAELRAEVIAEVVPSETVLYEVDTDLKGFTVEELYVRLDQELDFISETVVKPIDLPMIRSVLRPKRLETILGYFCELYRRNVNHHEFSPVRSHGYTPPTHWYYINMNMPMDNRDLNFYRGISIYKQPVKNVLSQLRLIKTIHLTCLDPIDKKINDLMDSILDANGNKISEFKDYLTDEQYRDIRAGLDVKDIKDPAGVLVSLQRMKTDMKSKMKR